MDTITRFEPTISTFANRVVEAILPLVDPEDREHLREDVGDVEVYAAVRPIFADYTVEDAVSASFALRAALDNDIPSAKPEHYEALCQARDKLQDFISRARPSSPACAAARVEYLIEEAPLLLITDTNTSLLYKAIAHDIECLRTNNFTARARKRRFGGAKWYPR